jgi:hypothetical protein
VQLPCRSTPASGFPGGQPVGQALPEALLSTSFCWIECLPGVPFAIPLIGHFNGRVLRDISHLPEPSLPVDLWIIGVEQLIRRQIGYTFLGSAVLLAGRSAD